MAPNSSETVINLFLAYFLLTRFISDETYDFPPVAVLHTLVLWWSLQDHWQVGKVRAVEDSSKTLLAYQSMPNVGMSVPEAITLITKALQNWQEGLLFVRVKSLLNILANF